MPNYIFSDAFAEIESIIGHIEKNSDGFAEQLRAHQIPHLSFSQIKSIEFCEQQYYIQYIENIELNPIPPYFVKGKLLHRVIAETYYQLQCDQNQPIAGLQHFIDTAGLEFSHHQHIMNATTLHLQNLWKGYEILGIEQPFVIKLDNSLPPLVGIIDLILKKDNEIVIVDHKTGSTFYDKDVLQGIIYKWFVSEKFQAVDVLFYYDNYRWVNNLDRIRKPALFRENITLPNQNFELAKERIVIGFNDIQRIRKKATSSLSPSFRKNGECFRCPYRSLCN